MSVITLPSPLWVRQTVANLIEVNRGHIDARMAAVDLGGSSAPTLKKISHSYRRQNNIDVGSLPAFHIEQRSQSNTWRAQMNMGRYQFFCTLWGFVLWDEPEQAQDLVSEYAAGVQDVLNQRHIPVALPRGYWMYWDGIMPVSELEYGAMEYANAIVHVFMATYSCHVQMSVPDSSPQRPF